MNERFDVIVTILELIGTSAFAASGALTAIKRRFDLFGVIIIGVTTAVGGGIMRDIVIGSHPVAAFRDPLAMSAAALISVLVFAALAVKGDLGGKALKLYDTAMLMLDTIGLGIFTVTGITAAMRSGVSDNTFLLVFSGVITGVGGGVLRDIFVNKKPEIFVGNIYACGFSALLWHDVVHACLHGEPCGDVFSKAHVGEIRLEFAENPDKSQTGAEDSRHERKSHK